MMITLSFIIFLLPELAVNISVSYTPPPGTELGPTQYRAASGPVEVTCKVMGNTNSVNYHWSSTCRDCNFQDVTNKFIRRGAVHSGDTGTHTCTAVSEGVTGNASIIFNVVGEQIHNQ